MGRLCSIIGLLCCIGCNLSNRRAHAIVRTQEDIQNISIAIQNYINDRGELPTEIPPEKEFQLDAKRVYRLLFQNTASKYVFGQPAQLWIQAGEITDRWGHPLNFRVQSASSNLFRISIWSNGPNGRNEGGIDDDICGKPFVVTAHR